MRNLVYTFCLVCLLGPIQTQSQELTGVPYHDWEVKTVEFSQIYNDMAMDAMFSPQPIWDNRDSTYEFTLYSLEKDPIKMNHYQWVNPAEEYIERSERFVEPFYMAPLHAWSFFYMQDSMEKVEDEWTREGISFKMDELENDDVYSFLYPFAMARTEVTNLQYKEFVYYIKNTLIRENLGLFIDGDPKNGVDYSAKLEYEDHSWKMDLSVFDYLGGDSSLESSYRFKDELLTYEYFDPESMGLKEVHILPDTNVWVNDFMYAYQEPMKNYYYWHPAYNDFPVVGVSYHQAKAYCTWLTMMLEQHLDMEGMLVADLPTPYEWYFAANYTGKHFNDMENVESGDIRLAADLLVQYNEDGNKTSFLNRQLNRDKRVQSFAYDGGYLTTQVDANRGYMAGKMKVKHMNNPYYHQPCAKMPSPFDGLENNVSEWMSCSYSQGMANVKTQRENYLLSMDSDAADLLIAFEEIYDGEVGQKLIYGSNFYDERYSSIYGKNTAGIFAKTWSDADKSYSTVGFRPVIRVMGPKPTY